MMGLFSRFKKQEVIAKPDDYLIGDSVPDIFIWNKLMDEYPMGLGRLSPETGFPCAYKTSVKDIVTNMPQSKITWGTYGDRKFDPLHIVKVNRDNWQKAAIPFVTYEIPAAAASSAAKEGLTESGTLYLCFAFNRAETWYPLIGCLLECQGGKYRPEEIRYRQFYISFTSSSTQKVIKTVPIEPYLYFPQTGGYYAAGFMKAWAEDSFANQEVIVGTHSFDVTPVHDKIFKEIRRLNLHQGDAWSVESYKSFISEQGADKMQIFGKALQGDLMGEYNPVFMPDKEKRALILTESGEKIVWDLQIPDRSVRSLNDLEFGEKAMTLFGSMQRTYMALES